MKRYTIVKRLFDFFLALIAISLLFLPFILIMIIIKLTSKGPSLYWSKRIGKENHLFFMPKFRTMRVGTPQVATHLMDQSDSYLTGIGKILRKTSLDEIPQLWSILKGDMSFVGPRPALFNQDDLVQLRTEKGIHQIIPGLTGWAQINGRDEIPIPEKVDLDFDYLTNRTFLLDFKIICLTFFRVIRSSGISH